MIISSASDYRAAAKRKLPRFLFDYIDGGAYAEHTMRANSSDLAEISLRQRILRTVDSLSLKTTLFGQEHAMPIILSPVGLTGMYARRGEVQAAKAAANKGIPFCLSTVSVCSIEEVASQSAQSIWFQLYVLKDRGFMRNALERAQAAGVTTLVFTVDMPTPGARYRDAHSGMSGPYASARRMLQAVTKPQWAWDVGVLGSTFRGQSGANQYAYGVEVGRLLRQNLWLSAGYNWTGFEGDRDLNGYEYTQQGLFLRLRFKFDEDLFRRDPVRYRDPAR